MRIFGTYGFVESINSGEVLRKAIEGSEPVELSPKEDWVEPLMLFLMEIQENRDISLFGIEEELSPTRWVIRLKG